MYINLALGVLVLGAIIWLLVIYNRKDETPREMLSDELARRRASQEAVGKIRERLDALRNTKLDSVSRALEEMRVALTEEGFKPERVQWRRHGGRLFLSIYAAGFLEFPHGPSAADGLSDQEEPPSEEYPAEYFDKRAEQFIISWDVDSINIDSSADPERLQSADGRYSLLWPDGSMTYNQDLPAFMRRISAMIADRVA